MAERVVYARAGEEIVCEAGHVVTRPTRDLHWHEKVLGNMLDGLGHLKACDPGKGILGDTFPACACGERWHWFGAFRFREGYRVIRDGAPVHLTLREISGGWQDRVAESAARAWKELPNP